MLFDPEAEIAVIAQVGSGTTAPNRNPPPPGDIGMPVPTTAALQLPPAVPEVPSQTMDVPLFVRLSNDAGVP